MGRFSIICLLSLFITSISLHAETLVEYKFAGDTNDSSGFGLHGELIGDAAIQDGRLFLPGDVDNTMSIPLGEFSPFGGTTSWMLSFDFQTVDESGGALFSADGSAECEDDPCRELWPEHEEHGNQTGSLNVFIGEEGQVLTDFWYMGVVASEDIYNDDEVHSYLGIYDADTGEFTQIIDGEDEVFGEFIFEREAQFDRTLVADESNGDFGFEFNAFGFHGYIDNVVIDSSGTLPAPVGPTGDFDLSGVLDLADINMLLAEIANGTNSETFDLTGDAKVDDADLRNWVIDLKKTWIGDANLDGEFNSGDLVDSFQHAKFEKDEDATWEQGDWNGDRRFSSGDFVEAFTDGGFEMGMRTAAQTVPEPSGFTILLFGVFAMTSRRKR